MYRKSKMLFGILESWSKVKRCILSLQNINFYIFAVLLCLVFTGGPDVSFRCAVSLQEGPAHRTQLDSTICSSTRHWHREEIYRSGGSNPLQTEPAGVHWPQICGWAAIGLIFSHNFSVTDNRPRINQEMHWRVWSSDRDRCASYIK